MLAGEKGECILGVRRGELKRGSDLSLLFCFWLWLAPQSSGMKTQVFQKPQPHEWSGAEESLAPRSPARPVQTLLPQAKPRGCSSSYERPYTLPSASECKC